MTVNDKILKLRMLGKTMREIGQELRPKMTEQGVSLRMKEIRRCQKRLVDQFLDSQKPIGPVMSSQLRSELDILNSWGFQIRSEAEMKEEDYKARQAEAEAIRRVREGAEIISEEIEDLV